jgi:hypothetical protein
VGYLLFGIYFLVISWLLIKTPFFKKLPVAPWVLILLFAIKTAAGLYYGWFYSHIPDYINKADTWRMYFGSLEETQWIKTDPAGFLRDLVTPRYQNSTGILGTQNSLWNDLKSVVLIKMMAVFNLLTGSRYYVNVIFYEYLAFFGPVAISRIFISYFPAKKWLIIAGAFIMPSVLLWCSGFHKDGLLLTVLGVAAWLVNEMLKAQKFAFGKILLLVFLLFISFLLRSYLPAFFVWWAMAWVLASYFPQRRWYIYIGMGVLLVGLFFATIYIPGVPNLPEQLANRQQEFFEMKGESLIQSQPLQGTAKAYKEGLPKALVNGFLQPLPWQLKKASYLPAALEILLFASLIIINLLFLLKSKRYEYQLQKNTAAPFLLFSLFFAGSVFLLTSFTIPYLGPIVRYKSVVWPFMLLPLLVCLPFKIPVLEKNK